MDAHRLDEADKLLVPCGVVVEAPVLPLHKRKFMENGGQALVRRESCWRRSRRRWHIHRAELFWRLARGLLLFCGLILVPRTSQTAKRVRMSHHTKHQAPKIRHGQAKHQERETDQATQGRIGKMWSKA